MRDINAVINDLVKDIPDYKAFLTVEELDASSRALAKKYPDAVKLCEIGSTRDGRPLLCLEIGEGDNALMFGCPHPNEPIGTMMLEYFTERLAADKALRDELGYRWHIVKAWDADGLKLNENWLKGPYTITNYSKNFFRPASRAQVDWTFPVDYKNLHFHAPLPETLAMKALIDRIKPRFTYSLHNAGFGGVYWYVTEAMPEDAYEALRAVPPLHGVPIHFGEPESPAIKIMSPAVLLAEGIEVEYDYLEKFGVEDPSKVINAGTCSDAYSKEAHGTFTFLTEMPYFYDPRICDTTVSDMTRRDAILTHLDWAKAARAKVREAIGQTRRYLSDANPFLMAIDSFMKDEGMDAQRREVESDPEYERLATVAEKFDNLTVTRFYHLLSLGMLARANETELNRKDLGDEAREALENGARAARALHGELAAELERTFDYEVIPIKKLVAIQLSCGLIAADRVKKGLK